MNIEFSRIANGQTIVMSLPEPSSFDIEYSLSQNEHESMTGKIWIERKANRRYIDISWDAMLQLYKTDIEYFFCTLREYDTFSITYNGVTYTNLFVESGGLQIGKVEGSHKIPSFSIYGKTNSQLITVSVSCFANVEV